MKRRSISWPFSKSAAASLRRYRKRERFSWSTSRRIRATREALGSLALADAKLGNKDVAISMLDLAESKDPSNVRPVARVISVYAAKGDAETAKQISREISERLPNSPDAATLRAEVSLATRDLADADTVDQPGPGSEAGFSAGAGIAPSPRVHEWRPAGRRTDDAADFAASTGADVGDLCAASLHGKKDRSGHRGIREGA